MAENSMLLKDGAGRQWLVIAEPAAPPQICEEIWLLEWSAGQRAFDLHPLAQAEPWYPGDDWRALALGQPAALQALAEELLETTMAYKFEKSRISFSDFLVRLELHGWRILSLRQFLDSAEPPQLHLEVVIMNNANMALSVAGPIPRPHWAENLFYQLVAKMELFGGRPA